ncbi:MAG: ABC transporter ATP-binding protein [Chloroflexi bacterium]|nr:MAG: ABC transporter ATP-binding protein [Chloroflexota bacterium]
MERFDVELRKVTKRFGEVTAVRDVTLQIRSGEFFSLLGPSGCGKTTTLRMIAGFEIPTSGQILIGGQVQGHLPPHKRPVNTVFQHYALFPHMTVYQNVAFGLEMQKVDKAEIAARVGQALELVHLTGMENRKPKQLSGGQQQRVALARALVNRPKVLLLDEPLGALDLKLRKNMQIELKNLQAEVGITFIYVTHDQEEALTMSDRIAVMNRGRVLQVGSPEVIYEQPENRFVADFIGETNFVTGVLQRAGLPVEIEVAGQLVQAGWLAEGVRTGETAVLSIRPEKIHLLPGSANGEAHQFGTAVSGQVERTIYLGTDTRYLIRLDAETRLVVRMQNTQVGHSHFAIGDTVWACWNPAHARVLSAEE